MFITSSAALTPDTVMYDSVFPTVEIDLMEGMDNMAVELGLTPAQAELMSSASASPESMLALVPHTGTQDRRTQLLLMGWPLHLPEPEVARHLYVYVSVPYSSYPILHT